MPLVLPPVPIGTGNAHGELEHLQFNPGRRKPPCSALHVATASGAEHFLKAVVSCHAPQEAAVPGGPIGVCYAACSHGVVFVWWGMRGKLSLFLLKGQCDGTEDCHVVLGSNLALVCIYTKKFF